MITKSAVATRAMRYAHKNRDEIQELSSLLGAGLKATGTLIASGFLLNRLKQKIQNNPRSRALIEDLIQNDPLIKEEDRDTVLQYYATIMNVAPSLALDKNAVRELLKQFIRFGKVDIQTLKILADTEKNIQQSKNTDLQLGKMFR